MTKIKQFKREIKKLRMANSHHQLKDFIKIATIVVINKFEDKGLKRERLERLTKKIC